MWPQAMSVASVSPSLSQTSVRSRVDHAGLRAYLVEPHVVVVVDGAVTKEHVVKADGLGKAFEPVDVDGRTDRR